MRESTAALPRLEQEVEEATAQLGEEEKKVEKLQEMANGEWGRGPGVTWREAAMIDEGVFFLLLQWRRRSTWGN